MPSITVTCPSCNTTLKPKTPVPGGTRLKCPKCATAFVTPADEAPSPMSAAGEDFTDAAEADAPFGDGDAPVKPKKKGIPLWAWLVGGGGALLLLCGGCCIGGFALAPGMMGLKVGAQSTTVTQANFDQIKAGMTEAEVKAIMGEPFVSMTPGGAKADVWQNVGGDQITVSFQNDRAVSIMYKSPTGTKQGFGQ